MIEQRVAGSGKVVIVGHRGALGHAPENTIVSFEKAAELGAHAFECDVHLSRDGEAVVIHDATVDRVTGGHGRVDAMTVAELKQLRVGAPPGSEYTGDAIPTLAEALDAGVRLGIETVIELKGEPEPPPALIERVVGLIQDRRLVDRVAIISFHHPSLLRVRELDGDIATGILFGHGSPDPIADARTYGANSIRPHHARVTRRMAEEAHEAGLCLHTWTVNEPDQARRLIELGVDSIGSDYPDRLHRLLTEMGRLA